MSEMEASDEPIDQPEQVPSRVPRSRRLTDGNHRAIAWLKVIEKCNTWEIDNRLGCSYQQVLNAVYGSARHDFGSTLCKDFMKDLRRMRTGLQRTTEWRSLGNNESWKRHAKDFVRSMSPQEIHNLTVWLVAVHRSEPYQELLEFSRQCEFEYEPFPTTQG